MNQKDKEPIAPALPVTPTYNPANREIIRRAGASHEVLYLYENQWSKDITQLVAETIDGLGRFLRDEWGIPLTKDFPLTITTKIVPLGVMVKVEILPEDG